MGGCSPVAHSLMVHSRSKESAVPASHIEAQALPPSRPPAHLLLGRTSHPGSPQTSLCPHPHPCLLPSSPQVTPVQAILASNTSSISITRLAAVTNKPHRCIGMHFMHPGEGGGGVRGTATRVRGRRAPGGCGRTEAIRV